ncbi:MAG: RNA polymerase I enhancer binding protein [Chaenotheca gracillima]|nr:MAG: RNA polymerase I enhancer binding protein [Chaenotheca gracillima]
MSSPPSSPSPTVEGAAYPWILEHILSYPGTYEISLRNMYTLNSSQGPHHQVPQDASRPATSQSASRPASNKTSPMSAEFPLADSPSSSSPSSAARFKANLMSQISQLPTQPCSLPASFVTAFVRRCFPEELELVDFPHALTSLDYMRDLEARRRRDLASALRSLGVDKQSLSPDGTEVITRKPQVAAWVKSMEDKERKVQALYTQVYIGIRRWMLINEMSLLPFNKSNCLAMLNTLYPPTVTTQPTMQLTPAILHSQRDGFFRYVKGVEKNGRSILENVMLQGRRPGRNDPTGWPSVRETLDLYLRAANGMIDECATIISSYTRDSTTFNEPGDGQMSPTAVPIDESSRKNKKFDSGVSFNSAERSSTSSTNSNVANKPLPPSPHARSGSTLEKIARELFRIRKKKDGDGRDTPAPKEEVKRVPAKLISVKKARSMGALADTKDKNRSFINSADHLRSETPAFDLDDEARKRAIARARNTPSRLKSRPLVDRDT